MLVPYTGICSKEETRAGPWGRERIAQAGEEESAGERGGGRRESRGTGAGRERGRRRERGEECGSGEGG